MLGSWVIVCAILWQCQEPERISYVQAQNAEFVSIALPVTRAVALWRKRPHKLRSGRYHWWRKKSITTSTAETVGESISPMTHRDGYVALADVRLHYVDYGGTGDPVLALHGLVQNAHAFDAIAPVLVPRRRLIAHDMRGRGRSSWGAPGS